jgi:hypothetical protein
MGLRPFRRHYVKRGQPSGRYNADVSAEIRCERAMAAAGGMQAATTVFDARPGCKDRTANEDKIRRILQLPR